MTASSHRDALAGFFERSGISLSSLQIDRFFRYYELLASHNDDLDLTRLTSIEDIAVKHFIDSIYFTEFIELPSPLIDIGSGAGFPGIPLKIYLPDLEITLSEPRKKRAAFLETTAKELQLSGLRVYPHMVTGLSDFQVRGAITRALESIDDTLARVLHFLPRGGRVIFMKGPGVTADLEGISETNGECYSLESDISYTLPGTAYDRRLVVFTKENDTLRKSYAILKDLTATKGTAVTSGENRAYRELKRIASGESPRKRGRILVGGRRIIAEMAGKGGLEIGQLILRDGHVEDDAGMISLIEEFARRRHLLVLKKSLYNEIDCFNTPGPLATIEIPTMKEWDRSSGTGCTLLIPFQDPVNVGASIRSAAGFGVEKIVVMKEAAHPFHPRSIRASSGSVFAVNIEAGPSIRELDGIAREKGLDIVSLDREGTPLGSFPFPERFLLVPGIEGPGLPEELKMSAVSIPLHGGVESLNGPVALSIALYEWRRQSPSK
ncbi:MAG: 16S rRNA (guanine(527)-N(7))-methyltransferase RsmG [Spirochaetes bacterium]|nr:16S rRNA (guanine(527)-N(7))-methyltransferase RsmG [Spirochaetota bacterium]